eukprot:gene22937-29710_t
MQSHVQVSIQKGWILPQLVDHTSYNTKLKLKGCTPYWIDKRNAIQNDIELDGIILLTAPNMSGKSTLMRAILSSAILASYDIPSEGKSAFALEMEDIKIVERDSSYKSLVMLDEIGKGTSAKD